MKNVLYNSCPDEELFGRYIDGEDAAFDAIVERHGSFVLNYLWRYLGDREAAEDLTQEVFIKVVKASGSFKKGSKFRTWLFSIMINCCFDHLRKLKGKKTVSLHDSIPHNPDSRHDKEVIDSIGNKGQNGFNGTMNREFKECFSAAIEKAPPEQKQVFILRELQGMQFNEIAEMLGLSENTVKSRMRYVLMFLRAELKDFL